MTVGGKRYIQGLIDQHLLGGVHDMIVTADNCIDFHGDIVDHHHKIVGGGTVTSGDDKVVQFVVLKNDISFNRIF